MPAKADWAICSWATNSFGDRRFLVPVLETRYPTDPERTPFDATLRTQIAERSADEGLLDALPHFDIGAREPEAIRLFGTQYNRLAKRLGPSRERFVDKVLMLAREACCDPAEGRYLPEFSAELRVEFLVERIGFERTVCSDRQEQHLDVGQRIAGAVISVRHPHEHLRKTGFDFRPFAVQGQIGADERHIFGCVGEAEIEIAAGEEQRSALKAFEAIASEPSLLDPVQVPNGCEKIVLLVAHHRPIEALVCGSRRSCFQRDQILGPFDERSETRMIADHGRELVQLIREVLDREQRRLLGRIEHSLPVAEPCFQVRRIAARCGHGRQNRSDPQQSRSPAWPRRRLDLEVEVENICDAVAPSADFGKIAR
jgi:hypothetical protein